jgi:glycosyltransferase involved in cell wall biosynthesis
MLTIENPHPKVTVLMSVYNGAYYLRESIESILNQSFTDFEFIIIDDCSTDKSGDIIREYAKQDQRIVVIKNEENIGLTKSLNKGLKLAKGEYIARQDADDISEPERLAKQVAFLGTHPEVALVGTWYKEIDAQGRLFAEIQTLYDCTQIRWCLLFSCTFVHSSVLFRKSTIIEQIGLYNEEFTYAQDYDFWCRIVRKFPTTNLQEYLMNLRVHSDSISSVKLSIQQDMALQTQIANLENLLGWEQAQKLSNGLLLRTMTFLWIGSLDELKEMDIKQCNKIIDEIFKIYHVFCSYYKLDKSNCRTHYIYLCNHLSNQILELSYCHFDQDKYTAWQFLIHSYLLYKPIVFTKRYMRLVLKLFLGSRLVNMMTWFSEYDDMDS